MDTDKSTYVQLTLSFEEDNSLQDSLGERPSSSDPVIHTPKATVINLLSFATKSEKSKKQILNSQIIGYAKKFNW